MNSRLVKKQELSKYQAEQITSYQIDWLWVKQKIYKKLVLKADSLVDKVLSCRRIKLSNSKNLLLDDVETTVLLSDFDQQLRRQNADALAN